MSSTASVRAFSTALTWRAGPVMVMVAGVGGDGFDAVSGRQRADDARLDGDLAGLVMIEDQAQARGSDLHDLDIVGNMNLVGVRS